MKKFIIVLTVSTFALAGTLHAADTKPAMDKAGCCDKAKEGSCCAEKSACSKTMSKRIALSPKAAQLAAR